MAKFEIKDKVLGDMPKSKKPAVKAPAPSMEAASSKADKLKKIRALC